MDLLGLDRGDLSALCEELGYPAFRGGQIAQWLYGKGVRSLDAMTNIPSGLRGELAELGGVTRSEVLKQSRSPDGATKFLLGLADDEMVEAVLLPYADRVSVCVSTQVGCAVGCVFCATAECGFVRNLSAGEIVDQVLTLQEQGGERVTHIVFMGMGEPLLNLANLLKAIRLLHEEVGISMRRLTVSTVGITPAIRRLTAADLPLTLAVSLHAPTDELRRRLIPLAAKYPLDELVAVCKEYADTTKRRVTFEYLLLAGVNDSPAQASMLARLLRGMLCHVNLIPYNNVIGKDFRRPTRAAIAGFRDVLEQGGIQVTQRLERGHAVSAACGQLRRQSRDADADA